MQSHRASLAVKRLLFNRLQFVACYTPVKDTDAVDFSTGVQSKKHVVTFLKGAVLSSTEAQTYVADASLLGHSRKFTMGGYLDVSKRTVLLDGEASDDSYLLINGVRWDVVKVLRSEFIGLHSVSVEKVNGLNSYSVQVQALIDSGWFATPRVTAYVDKLWLDVLSMYAGEVPVTLELWPVAGTNVSDSARLLFPLASKEVLGDVQYREVGRRSGYSGSGTVGGYVGLAKNLPQTNAPELVSVLQEFNTRMGRL